MEAIETGRDKVKKICEVLRHETLEPAIREAKEVLEKAKHNADQIVEEAKARAVKMIAEAEKEIEKKYTVFKASLNQGARQSIEWLKQEIEERILNENLHSLIVQATASPQVLSDMVQALVKAVEDEGLETDLSAIIPSHVKADEINALVGKRLLEKLKEKSVIIGSQKGGIEMKLHNQNVKIDLTDKALFELMLRYVRKNFHEYFFANKK